MAKTTRIAKVTWGDAHSCHMTWKHYKKVSKEKPKKVISVGTVVQDDEYGMTLVLNSSGPMRDSGIFIPRVNIVEVEDL